MASHISPHQTRSRTRHPQVTTEDGDSTELSFTAEASPGEHIPPSTGPGFYSEAGATLRAGSPTQSGEDSFLTVKHGTPSSSSHVSDSSYRDPNMVASLDEDLGSLDSESQHDDSIVKPGALIPISNVRNRTPPPEGESCPQLPSVGLSPNGRRVNLVATYVTTTTTTVTTTTASQGGEYRPPPSTQEKSPEARVPPGVGPTPCTLR